MKRLAVIAAVSALAALQQPAGPPPVFAAHTPAQTGKQWVAGTATAPAQTWTYTNYWTCNAATCRHVEITPNPATRGVGP